MASQLTVLGPAARRHVAKVTPGSYLSDVLGESCAKFRLDPAHYGLKHQGRAVDLSRTVRLSGLPSGAKLELTQVSRSPAVVSVALQLPDGARLLDKFPSTTSLWLLLRKFEAGAAGGAAQRNFTARGVARAGGDGASGRLYHEAPALHIVGRDYAAFEDLQKTLGQIGFNNGSVLLKLSFAASEVPLEQAIERMAAYFESVAGGAAEAGGVEKEQGVAPSEESGGAEEEQAPAPSEEKQETATQADPTPSEAPVAAEPVPAQPTSSTPPPPPVIDTAAEPVHYTPASPTSPSGARRRTLVYAPPDSTTPQAALHGHDERDYVPSVEHARAHQAGLSRATQNRRLATDAELEAEAAAAAQKLAATAEVTIKVRFPDQSSAVAPFGGADTAADLYAHVRSLLAREDEPFALQVAGPKGQTALESSGKKLIGGLGLTGRVMVGVVWAAGASAEARKGPSLKREVAEKQQQYKVREVVDTVGNEVVKGGSDSKGDGDGKGKKKDGVPKWLKFGKK